MSFILDALKKSETDRQRQGGPALFEVKVAPPRSGLPGWAVVVVVLFVVNLLLVGWLLLRRNAPAPQVTQAVLPASPAPAAVAPAPGAPGTPAPPPAAAPTGTLSALSPGHGSAGEAMSRGSGVGAAPAPAADAAAASAADQGSNPDDFAPAAEPPPSGSLGRVKHGAESGVPVYQQLAATPNVQLPQLHLDLHAYADRAEDRWVMINMHKLREGDSLEGVHVERITPDGAVLSFQGTQFLLTQE
jgi:general secretion pathway protein B